MPYVVGMSQESIIIIAFTTEVDLAEQNEIKNTEVAVVPKRTLQGDRTETLLTEEGYRQFDIKPALEFSVIDSVTEKEINVDFEWEIIEFAKDHVKIKVNFEDPESLSSSAKPDEMEITFWGDKLFKG